MLPNWLLGKSKSKLQEILGGGGGGTTYTAGDGIDISNGIISFDPATTPAIDPSKVDGLDDDLAALAAKTQITNPNLFDNPWFTVNQRGESNYTTDGSKSIYTVDRFQIYKTSGLSLTVNNDGTVTLANSGSGTNCLYQVVTKEEMSKLLGKTVTLSVLCSDGVLFTKTGTLPSTAPSSFTSVFALSSDSSHSFSANITMGDGSDMNQLIRINMPSGKSCSFKAVKLELGSVSTLAMDTAPNYATELLKCQRYFNRFWYSEIGWAHCIGTDSWAVIAHLPCIMRATPAISLDGTIGISVAANDIRNGTPTIQNYNEGGTPINIGFTLNGITGTVGEVGRVFIGNSHLTFSAEL